MLPSLPLNSGGLLIDIFVDFGRLFLAKCDDGPGEGGLGVAGAAMVCD